MNVLILVTGIFAGTIIGFMAGYLYGRFRDNIDIKDGKGRYR